MPSLLAKSDYLTLRQAAELLGPPGKPVGLKTLRKWIRVGARKRGAKRMVRLACIEFPGGTVVSRLALDEFVVAYQRDAQSKRAAMESPPSRRVDTLGPTLKLADDDEVGTYPDGIGCIDSLQDGEGTESAPMGERGGPGDRSNVVVA
jgi:hypothetical protein